MLYDKFGGIKQFCRLGTFDDDGNYAGKWRKQHIVGIGWLAVGSLENYLQSNGYTGKDIDKKALSERMKEENYQEAGVASRKAGELQTFYKTTKDSIFVLMDGERLPKKSEGHMTSCVELRDDENLLFLYKKYYYSL